MENSRMSKSGNILVFNQRPPTGRRTEVVGRSSENEGDDSREGYRGSCRSIGRKFKHNRLLAAPELTYRQYFRLAEARKKKPLTEIQQASLERLSIDAVDVSTNLSNAE